MKTKRIVSLLVSVIMAVGTVTAVPFTASATELNAPIVSAKSSLATPKITKAESVNNGVKISWGRVNGAARYRVYYKGSKGWTRLAVRLACFVRSFCYFRTCRFVYES